MAKLIAGTASFQIDGVIYTTNGEFDCTILNTKKEAVTTDNPKILFYKETIQPSVIKGKLFLTDELDPTVVTNIANSVIQVQLKSGKVAILRDAFFSGDGTASAQDGTLDVEFSGIGSWV
jgi:hypothetical protein